MTLANALTQATATLKRNRIHTDDAVLLLAHCLGTDVTSVLSNPHAPLPAPAEAQFKELIRERSRGRSVAVLVGTKYFYGLKFLVTEDTLIPRPESELLVETALAHLNQHAEGRILDMGTGCGNLAIALAVTVRAKGTFTVAASDISARALSVAKKNAKEHGVSIRFFNSNLFSNIPAQKFTCIVANLPYLKTGQLHEPSIRHEPLGALWGGSDGTDLYAEFFKQTGGYVSPGSLILVEIDPDQKNKLTELVQSYLPKARVEFLKDLSGRDRACAVYC